MKDLNMGEFENLIGYDRKTGDEYFVLMEANGVSIIGGAYSDELIFKILNFIMSRHPEIYEALLKKISIETIEHERRTAKNMLM